MISNYEIGIFEVEFSLPNTFQYNTGNTNKVSIIPKINPKQITVPKGPQRGELLAIIGTTPIAAAIE